MRGLIAFSMLATLTSGIDYFLITLPLYIGAVAVALWLEEEEPCTNSPRKS